MMPAPLPWYIVILTGVPQTFLSVKTGFQLFNQHINRSRALILSLIVSIIAIFARELPLPYGFHTLIIIVSTAILAAIFTMERLWHCFISIITGVIILGALEVVFVQVFLDGTVAPADFLTLKPWMIVLYSLPEEIIMAVIYFLAKKRNYMIFDLSLDRD